LIEAGFPERLQLEVDKRPIPSQMTNPVIMGASCIRTVQEDGISDSGQGQRVAGIAREIDALL
jgi:hypothetical protein